MTLEQLQAFEARMLDVEARAMRAEAEAAEAKGRTQLAEQEVLKGQAELRLAAVIMQQMQTSIATMTSDGASSFTQPQPRQTTSILDTRQIGRPNK